MGKYEVESNLQLFFLDTMCIKKIDLSSIDFRKPSHTLLFLWLN